VDELHSKQPLSLLYATPGFPYSALPERMTPPTSPQAIRRTRGVPTNEAVWKVTVPVVNAAVMLGCSVWTCFCSCGLSSLLLVRVCLPWCQLSKLSAACLCVVVLATVLTLFLFMGGLLAFAALFTPEFGAYLIAGVVQQVEMGVTTKTLTSIP
jgi:hypothetical protein